MDEKIKIKGLTQAERLVFTERQSFLVGRSLGYKSKEKGHNLNLPLALRSWTNHLFFQSHMKVEVIFNSFLYLQNYRFRVVMYI